MAGSMSARLPEGDEWPRSLPMISRVGRLRRSSRRKRSRSISRACPSPVTLDHLSFRPSTVALRVVDNMQHRRPRDPDLLRDRRRLVGLCARRFVRIVFCGPAPPPMDYPAHCVRAAGPLRLPPSSAGRAGRRPAGAGTGPGRPAGRPRTSSPVGRYRSRRRPRARRLPQALAASRYSGHDPPPFPPSRPVRSAIGARRPSPPSARALERPIDTYFRPEGKAIRHE